MSRILRKEPFERCELEGKDVDGAASPGPHKQEPATGDAIRKCVKQHKKALAEHTGAQDYNKEKVAS